MEKIEVNKIINWLKINWILVLILLVGAFLRLKNIEGYMTFLGDEGRDAIIVRNLLVNSDPILIGPGTSVGGMYLGPLYYYFMAPFLFLANFSPTGPSIGVALLGVLTIWLIYWVCKEWFSSKHQTVSLAGIVAALFYAISPTVIVFSRSSWNPNIMPFFSLLAIYSIWRVWKKDDYKFLFVSSISLAFVLQSHYLGLLLIPVIGIIWIFKFLLLNTKTSFITEKTPLIKFIKSSIFAVLIFLFLMSPLLIFDIRHNWMNFNALKTFLEQRQTSFAETTFSTIEKIPEIATDITSSLIAGKNRIVGQIFLAIISIPSLLILLGRKKLHPNEVSGFSILFLWIVFGLMGFVLYKHPIYDHYYGFLFPVPFILMGGFVQDVFENLSRTGKLLLTIALSLLFFVNLVNNPLRYHPNNQLQRSIDVANKILEIADNKPFNLAVLAERNYEDGYRYFLELNNAAVLHADRWDQNTISDTLVVVCEMEETKCDPTHSPKAEVANFGWSKIYDRWEIDGVIIYKLIHPNNEIRY